MSEPAKPRKKPAPKKLEHITLKDLQELWPKTDDGRLCARLLQRFMFSRLTETARGAECTPLTAASEAGANKAHAILVQDFGTLGVDLPPPPMMPKMAQLHRHQDPEKPKQ